MNWPQLQTILWLRGRLMRNQWGRSGGLGAVLAIIMGMMALGLGAACFIGGLAGGLFGLAHQRPQVIMLVWLGLTAAFLLFWMIGLLTELQRSEAIDLQKLMHLPVALGQMFVINYIASHFTFSMVIAIPAIFGLGLGLTLGRGPEMILLIPLALSMVLMVSAWTYCLRGWLATMMSNPRRRRAITMFITMFFFLLAQGPNLYLNVLHRHQAFSAPKTQVQRGQEREEKAFEQNQFIAKFQAAEGFVPPMWVPMGAEGLAAGNPLPALAGTLGCAVMAALGLLRGYRATVRFYLGDSNAKVAAERAVSSSASKGSRPSNRRRFLEYAIPLVPEQSAALGLATLRSLLRAPEVKMAWATSFIISVILAGFWFFRISDSVPEVAKPFIATGSVVLPVFLMMQFFSNQFGFDRDGFRALMLSPADRRLILLGKNLAAWPVAMVFGGLLLTITSLRLHLPPMAVAAAVLQFASVLLMAAVAGNFLSLLAPYRIQPGSIKPTKMSALATIIMILSQMLLPTVMAPVFAGPLLELGWRKLGWPQMVPVNLVVSAAMAAVMALIYWQSLSPLGRLLQRREAKILAVITVEVE